MKLYSIYHEKKGLIQYRDKKRTLWLASVFFPLLPLYFISVYLRTGQEAIFVVPLIVSYVIIPLLDWMIGTDSSNPPEEIVPLLEEDKYYRYLTFLTVPMHFIVLIACAWLVGTHTLSFTAIFLVAIMAGGYSGIGINTAHELGHKNTWIEQLLAKIVLAVPAYGHFTVEHNSGHHVKVSTPEDPASSRMGESIYSFAVREIPETFNRAWLIETKRLEKLKKPALSFQNQIIQSYALSLLLQGSLVLIFGVQLIAFLAIHNIWAWLQLTSANYIEHYGLLRAKKSNGRYERCKPHHSWNTNYVLSNVVLFHLERHSDHHAYPARRYQSLRNFDDIPELPNGYFGMYLCAYIPKLWFKIMDHRLLSLPHINGDLSKVNICPNKRDAIIAKYN